MPQGNLKLIVPVLAAAFLIIGVGLMVVDNKAPKITREVPRDKEQVTDATSSPQASGTGNAKPASTTKPTSTVSTAASSSSSAGSTSTASSSSETDQTEKNKDTEQLILKYTNEEREENDLPALVWDSKLTAAARAHSTDMAKQNYFSHISLSGKDPWARVAALDTTATAENIGKMGVGKMTGIGMVKNTPESVARAQVRAWMASDGHRDNILSATVKALGVGVAYDGTFYLSTQVFR